MFNSANRRAATSIKLLVALVAALALTALVGVTASSAATDPFYTADELCKITLEPTSSDNTVGNTRTLTATVTSTNAFPIYEGGQYEYAPPCWLPYGNVNQNDELPPIEEVPPGAHEGIDVLFETTSGPSHPLSGHGTTNAGGVATFTYTSSLEGTDNWTASAEFPNVCLVDYGNLPKGPYTESEIPSVCLDLYCDEEYVSGNASWCPQPIDECEVFEALVDDGPSCEECATLSSFSVADTGCETPDPCIANPQSSESCDGYDPCIANPQSSESCDGYDPCVENPQSSSDCAGYDPCLVDPQSSPICPGYIDPCVNVSVFCDDDVRAVHAPRVLRVYSNSAGVTWTKTAPVTVQKVETVGIATSARCHTANKFRVRPSSANGQVASMTLYVNGKKVSKTTGASESFTINAAKYGAGPNAIKLVTTFTSGKVVTTQVSFKNCKPRIAKRKASPRFTG